MSLDVLADLIYQWGDDRRIIKNGKTIAQGLKTLEEVKELLTAINTGDKIGIKDGVGDVFVTLVMICGIEGIDIEDCVEYAYNEIKDRKGYLREDGTFIKVEP